MMLMDPPLGSAGGTFTLRTRGLTYELAAAQPCLVQPRLVLRGDLDVGHLPLDPRGDGEQHQGHEQCGHA